MWWDLQYGGLQREALRHKVAARLGAATCFLYPNRSAWDAPNQSGHLIEPSKLTACRGIPTPQQLNVRGSLAAAKAPAPANQAAAAVGSNNWAVAGALTSTGGALVANDMHLNLRVPTTWYRARLKTHTLDLNGVTLPGTPVLVAGSNGHIAWGFSNSYGDWLDLDSSGSPHWLATVPEATNLRLMDFETSKSVDEALALAPLIGVPHQNLVIGDRDGHVAWTIAGRIPQALGVGRNDGSSPWLPFADHPRIVDPPLGRVWAANARATDDERQELAVGGDEAIFGAEYDLGARAQQIRDDLLALHHPATPADMLAIQLDDRALFLARWRELALRLLDPSALRQNPRREQFKRWIAGWGGHAAANSVGYRLVRDYRNRTEAAVWQMILRALELPSTDTPPPARFEVPLWTLVTEQPRHMLAANYASWREFLLGEIDATLAANAKSCTDLAQCVWGKRNPVRVRHPLSGALPVLAPLLDMPVVELAGDHDMPRVQDGPFGASERFAVTPGLESQGYLDIAGGQSGHPLSPYYRAGFQEWAEGTPVAFLPGTSAHRLLLTPR